MIVQREAGGESNFSRVQPLHRGRSIRESSNF